MTATAELLQELARRRVELWAEGDRLRFRAPAGVLTPELRQAIRQGKQDLLHALGGDPRTSPPPKAQLPTVEPEPAARFEPFPLTDLQEAYWLGTRQDLELGGIRPHVYAEYDLPDIDFQRFQNAWQQMLARHDMLRLVVSSDGQQRVLREVPDYDIPVQDLRDVPTEEIETRLAASRRRMCHQGPSVSQWPPFELEAFRLGPSHYRLHWNLSLLLCDDWSYQILAREWFQLYRDPAIDLPPLDITFRDYVMATHRFEDTAVYRRSLDWWREGLPEMPPAPQLPLARPPAELGPPRFERRTSRLAGDRWQRLKDRCRSAGVTPSSAVCAAYAEVLAAWSAERRFTLNLLFFNRLPVHEQIGRLVGNFSSTVLLPLDLASRESFTERTTRLQRDLWRHIRHSRVSGIRVLRELARERRSALTAGAPVVFASNLTGERDEDPTAAPDLGRVLYTHLQTSQVWLDHQVFEIDGGLHLNWDAVEGLFPEGQVEAMFQAYQHLLERLADDLDAWTQTVRSLTPADQLERRRRVNDTALELPRHRLEELFAESAHRDPELPAVLDPDLTLSYSELASRAAALTDRLLAAGVEPNRPVAAVSNKGWHQAVATLGILGAGVPYLPVDPELPVERFRKLLVRAGVRIAVTTDGVDAPVWPDDVRRIPIETASPHQDGRHRARPHSAADDTALAYVIYTSGSTGEPKGVAIDHQGAANTVLDVNRRFSIGPEDRVLALSSLSFDLSVYDLFGTFAAGATVVYPEADREREPAHWLELMEQKDVTVWNSVPALLEMLVDHCEGLDENLPPSLRLVLLSGDWIPVTLPDRIRGLRPETQIVSLGGATEASIWSIFHRIDRVPPTATSIPYGRPLANQTFHVLDEIGEPRPTRVPGELYIGGVGVARGYWRDEERTRAAFVEHPVTGERLYRTGDLGRWRDDDEIEFLGRRDLQVKVQGYRIELGEIEVVLERHPAVRQAVATALGETRGPKRLVAYAVPEPGHTPAPEELASFLENRLPAYMVPTRILRLERLPLSANGKVDRSRLPSPKTVEESRERMAPRNEVERRLVALWEDVLDCSVGVRDDFFELGGHSLLAVRLMTRIRQELGRDLPLSALLEGATVEHLAIRIKEPEMISENRGPSLLVTIRPPEEPVRQTAFFCVHPSGGNVLCYRSLAAAMPDSRGFYGIQAPALTGGDLPESLEDLAEHYLSFVTARQPAGPYLVGGWSMGGVVAFEMVRCLAARGRAAAAVLIDSLAPKGEPPPEEAILATAFDRDLARLVDPVRTALSQDERRRLFDVFRANYGAMTRYAPADFDGPVALFKAAEGLGGDSDDDSLGWRRHVSRPLEVYTLPGDHYSIVHPPAADLLARHLSEVLSRFEAEL